MALPRENVVEVEAVLDGDHLLRPANALKVLRQQHLRLQSTWGGESVRGRRQRGGFEGMVVQEDKGRRWRSGATWHGFTLPFIGDTARFRMKMPLLTCPAGRGKAGVKGGGSRMDVSTKKSGLMVAAQKWEVVLVSTATPPAASIAKPMVRFRNSRFRDCVVVVAASPLRRQAISSRSPRWWWWWTLTMALPEDLQGLVSPR